MFCPNCKTEYRPGVRGCSDCHVPLVDTLPVSRGASAPADNSVDSDLPILLWDGMDPRALASIRAALDAKGIVYSDRPQDDPLLRTISRDPLEIWIQKQDEPAAREIVTDLFGDDSADDSDTVTDSSTRELADNSPQQDGSLAKNSADDEDDEQVDDIVEDFDPRDATCEVWAGSDKQMAQIFDDCLRNVGIGCVLSEAAGKTRVLVLPAAEKRAREVIREIVEQSPPK
jgi:hypothetical protein